VKERSSTVRAVTSSVLRPAYIADEFGANQTSAR
jgi:hypothetical protein